MAADLRAAKGALRRRCLAAREAMSPALRAARSASIAARLRADPGYRGAGAVALYASFGSEVDTTALIEDALAGGRRVALPRVARVAGATGAIRFFWIGALEADTAPGVWGIREPRPHCAEAVAREFDWVLVPGAAFDTDGGRIGYGAGYYDRFLPALPPRCERVAACFEDQIVDRVPLEAHDARVDRLVTEARVIDCRR